MYNLVQCPFCGGDAQATISSARYYADVVAEVGCTCGAKISRRIMDGTSCDVVEKTFAGIIKQWNNRYRPTSEDQNSEDCSEWNIIGDDRGGFYYRCSKCNYKSERDSFKYCPDCGRKIKNIGGIYF